MSSPNPNLNMDAAANVMKAPNVDDVKEAAQNTMKEGGKDTVMIVLILAVMCLIVIVIFIIISIIRNNKLKSVVLHSSMIDLSNRSIVPHTITSDKIPSITNNSQEYSYSFWIFLGNKYDQTTSHKLLFSRGNTDEVTGSFSNLSNPLIFMDKSSNKLYIAVATTAATTSVTLSDILGDNNGNTEVVTNGVSNRGFILTHIDYVPLQRWVNVTVVIKGIYVNIYYDGDLYTVASVHDIKNSSTTPMIRGTSGEIVIGNNTNTIHGHISLTQMFNFSLNQKDIKKIYKKGPVRSSWLSVIGLGNYGVRTPIYELS